MKIESSEGIFQIPDTKTVKKHPESPNQGFTEIFEKALKPAQPQAAAPAATGIFRPVVPMLETDQPVSGQPGIFRRVEQLLDLLEDYRRHLLRPDTGLKTLDELVKKLDGQRRSLTPVVGELPEGDGLKTILNESLVTASVEIFKFNRGDYLA